MDLTKQERRIIGSALPALHGPYYQPAADDQPTADDLLARGLLAKMPGWPDVLQATPAGQDTYWSDMDSIKESKESRQR